MSFEPPCARACTRRRTNGTRSKTGTQPRHLFLNHISRLLAPENDCVTTEFKFTRSRSPPRFRCATNSAPPGCSIPRGCKSSDCPCTPKCKHALQVRAMVATTSQLPKPYTASALRHPTQCHHQHDHHRHKLCSPQAKRVTTAGE